MENEKAVKKIAVESVAQVHRIELNKHVLWWLFVVEKRPLSIEQTNEHV